MIGVCSSIAASRFRLGFSEDTTMGNSFALVNMDNDDTNYEISSDDGTTETTSTTGTIPVDIAYHSHKLELTLSNVQLTIDGVLDITKTTNLPDVSQQPFFAVKARSAGAKTGNIRYMEAYNT